MGTGRGGGVSLHTSMGATGGDPRLQWGWLDGGQECLLHSGNAVWRWKVLGVLAWALWSCGTVALGDGVCWLKVLTHVLFGRLAVSKKGTWPRPWPSLGDTVFLSRNHSDFFLGWAAVSSRHLFAHVNVVEVLMWVRWLLSKPCELQSAQTRSGHGASEQPRGEWRAPCVSKCQVSGCSVCPVRGCWGQVLSL